ncbi:MAG: sulfite exporter TauE/SafE family protein [Polyangiaceae bacterium]|nr:sulfite exporter TauE/SafE family protein [Polyangiaceae bacterium]
MDFHFTIAGFAVGALIGATGVGGGSLMTPILVLLFGVHPATAVGTDLLFASVTKGVGTALHGLNQSISWKVVSRLCAGSIPASLAMLWLVNNYFDPEVIGPLITTSLGVALLITSLAIFFQPLVIKYLRSRGKTISDRPTSNAPGTNPRVLAEEQANESRPEAAALTVLTGVVLGSLVSLTSVGAGALGVMVLMALYPRVRSVRIVGTDIAHAVPLTLLAGVGHAPIGGVDFSLLGGLLLGSIPGIALGSHVAFRLPERVMRQTLAVILMLVGGRLVF